MPTDTLTLTQLLREMDAAVAHVSTAYLHEPNDAIADEVEAVFPTLVERASRALWRFYLLGMVEDHRRLAAARFEQTPDFGMDPTTGKICITPPATEHGYLTSQARRSWKGELFV